MMVANNNYFAFRIVMLQEIVVLVYPNSPDVLKLSPEITALSIVHPTSLPGEEKVT